MVDADPVTFEQLRSKLGEPLYKALTSKPFNLTKPSPVQHEVFNLLPEVAQLYDKDSNVKRDLLVKAKTGTGKTIGFLVPAILNRLAAIDAVEKAADGPANAAHKVKQYVRSTVGTLIISPTRELATQIAVEAQKLCSHTGLETRLFTGGTARGAQLRDFQRGRRDIVVATPGRLLDLLNAESDVAQSFKNLNVLVLDEADTLLEMGFREDIESVIHFLPPSPQRQTMMFSATLSKAIQQIARAALSPEHNYIDVVPAADSSPVHAHIPQYATVLESADQQIPHVMRLIQHDQLANPGKSKIILFCQTTKQTQLFSTMIRELKTNASPAGRGTFIYEIHSGKGQTQRDRASSSFRGDYSGASILVTSDVSARGVDYPGVTRVIQVGIPAGPEQYIHRVGRTGRAGASGRGDIVLLPFENKWIGNCLNNVPIKPLPVEQLERETLELAAEHDADPRAFFPASSVKSKPRMAFQRDAPREAIRSYRTPVVRVVEQAQEECTKLCEQLDEEAISQTHVALLGFYGSRVDELRQPRRDILDGLNDWAVTGLGLPNPPHISDSMLAKVGFAERAGRSGGRDGGRRSFGGDRRSSFGGGETRSSYGMKRGQTRTEGEWSGAPREGGFRRGGRDGEDRPRRFDGPRKFGGDDGPRKFGRRDGDDLPREFRPRNRDGDSPREFRPRGDRDGGDGEKRRSPFGRNRAASI
ncbi:DEAD-domain-containing protein [Peniophora sp. CONT]|nr:DEAD-domain-containing protein [Peniophora sp. CONT]